MTEKINTQEGWRDLVTLLSSIITLKLTRGSEFKAIYDSDREEIRITPQETGITRFIGKQEWLRFVEKFNQVIDSGYDPLRPGHYARISFNASYLIAIWKFWVNWLESK